MEIVGFEKLSLVDYDGHTACTVFTGGCNFRCPFCHNGDIVLHHSSFERIDESEILSYLIKRKGLLDGVVVSGGEPTLQSDLASFLTKVKAIGYYVKLDSNGSKSEILKELIDRGLVDYIAMDIKADKFGYGKAIGLKGMPAGVLESVELLKSGIIEYELRITLVSELIDEEAIINMSEWLKGVSRIYLQRFYDRDECIVRGLSEVPKNIAEEYAEIFNKHGIPAILRNYD